MTSVPPIQVTSLIEIEIEAPAISVLKHRVNTSYLKVIMWLVHDLPAALSCLLTANVKQASIAHVTHPP